MKMNIKPLTLAIGLVISATAQADLARMGPVNPATGYPTYYQDNNGLALDLCIPTTAQLIAGDCLLLPVDVPNANAAISFPGNFPEEAFWWNATTSTPLIGPDPVTGDALLVMALEAAFAGGPVLINDQIVFSRIRYKFIAPVDGSYTVQTPYSTDTFEATAGELVFNTSDIGINCAPGDFSCAMKGKTAPFLRASGTPGGAPLGFVSLNGGTFLADPAVDTPVTGGTVGNIFKITGPNGVIAETDQFSLMGRVHTAPLPRAVTLDRVSYARAAGTAHIDAFVTSLSGIGAATPTFHLVGRDLPGVRLTQDPSAASKFHGQTRTNDPAALPVTVSIIDTTDNPPSVLTGDVTDVIKVTSASYSGGTLSVQASSSDTFIPPTIRVTGSNGQVYGNLTGGSGTFGGLTTAPSTVIVTSSAGGRTEVPVSTTATAVAGNVIAVNDLPADPNAINVLANDDGIAGAAIVRIVKQPEHGTVSVGAGNIIAYSPAGTYAGPDNFTYYVDNGGNGISNVASVDFTVTSVNRAPIANADNTASVPGGASVTIDVVANDTDPDNNPLTITAVGTPSGTGTTATLVSNKIVFTATSAAATGNRTFTYTVSDGNGGSATGNVTVNVLAAETIGNVKANYSTRNRTWDVAGVDLPVPSPAIAAGVTVRFYAGTAPAIGVAEDETKFFGQAIANAADGRFKFGPTGSTVIPVGSTFHIRSSRGFVQNFTHTITN